MTEAERLRARIAALEAELEAAQRHAEAMAIEAQRAFRQGRAYERRAQVQRKPTAPPKGELYVVRDISEAA